MPFPMIKDEKKLEHAHIRIYETIKDYLAHGKNVGMLTIGDRGYIRHICTCIDVQLRTTTMHIL